MIYVFDDYELDISSYELRHTGKLQRIEPKVFELLAYLIKHHSRVVSKEELLENLWPDRFVSESALTYSIRAARKAIRDTGRAQRLLKTVYGRGYRFVAPVQTRQYPKETEAETPLIQDMATQVEASQEPPQAPPGVVSLPAERRQLTVIFCRVRHATTPSKQLDLDDLHEVRQRAQRACVDVIRHFEGHIAQYAAGTEHV